MSYVYAFRLAANCKLNVTYISILFILAGYFFLLTFFFLVILFAKQQQNTETKNMFR